MKKRISLLLALITVIAAMVLVLSFSASAAADPVHTTAATDGAYAEIYTSSGTVKATLSDVSSGVAAFFAKAGDGDSIHLYKDFTTAEQIWIYGSVLFDGNNHKITSTNTDCAIKMANTEKDTGWKNSPSEVNGAIDTLRVKNLGLYSTTAHGFMFYCSSVLSLEDGNDVTVKAGVNTTSTTSSKFDTNKKIIYSARNGGKVIVTGGTYRTDGENPVSFTSSDNKGANTVWTEWEIGGTWVYEGTVPTGYVRMFQFGDGARTSLVFRDITFEKGGSGYSALIAIESQVTAEKYLLIDGATFDGPFWVGAYVNTAGKSIYLSGDIVGKGASTVVNVRAGNGYITDANIYSETAGKMPLDIGSDNKATLTITDSTVTGNGTYAVRVGDGDTATITGSTIKATGQNALYVRKNATATVKDTEIESTKAVAVNFEGSGAKAYFSEDCTVTAYGAVAVNVPSGATFTDSYGTFTTLTENGGSGSVSNLFAINSAGTLELSDSTVSSSAYYGMQISGGTAVLDWVTVNCTAGNDSAEKDDANYYGALTVSGAATVTATDCIFTTDVISNGTMPVRIGGAATITFEDCEFNGKATPYGGSVQTGTLEINNASTKVTFKGDITGSYSYIIIRKGSIILDGATTKAISNDDDTNAKNIEIKNASTVNGNIKVGYTKGASTDTLTITGSTVNGAVTANSIPAVTVTSSTIKGSITVTGGVFTLTNSEVEGFVAATNTTSTTIENPDIYMAGNNALRLNGTGTITVTGGTIESTGEGCPVTLDGGAAVTLTNVEITAAGRSAIEARSENAKATVKDCTINVGTLASKYALILISGKNASVTFEDTTAIVRSGNAVQLKADGASFTMISGILKVASGGSQAIYSEGAKTTTTVYDGYVINEGTGQAFGAASTSGKYANLTVYGGHFIVLATNGCTNTYNKETVEGFDNGSYFYGGQVYNFQSQAEKGYSFGAAQNVKKRDCVEICNLSKITTSVNSLYNDIAMDKSKNQLALKAGAQVRIVDDGTNGIRFVSDIPKATLDLVAKIADDGTYTYGTAIVPTKFLTENGLKAFSITALEQLGKTVLKIPATEKGTVKNADGSVTLNAALIGMSDAQLKLAYSAMPYIEYTVDGHTVYMCGVYDAVDHTRTIADVAERALVDVRATAGWDDVQKDYYNTEVEINGQIWYSCYDEDQLEILKQYAAVDGTGDDYAGLAAADDGTDNIANAGAILE